MTAARASRRRGGSCSRRPKTEDAVGDLIFADEHLPVSGGADALADAASQT
jgi:hypothetical protein